MTKQKIPVGKYVEVSSPRGSERALLALLYPLSPGQAAPNVGESRTPGSLGLQIGGSDWVAFKLGTQSLRVGDVETDADSVFLRFSEEVIERLAVDSATRVSRRNQELLSSNVPISLAAVWDPRGCAEPFAAARQ